MNEVIPVEIEWIVGDPPAAEPSSYLSYQHQAVARMLRDRPGVWAELVSFSSHYAAAIRSGTMSAYRPGGSYEAVSRRGRVFARYVGGESS